MVLVVLTLSRRGTCPLPPCPVYQLPVNSGVIILWPMGQIYPLAPCCLACEAPQRSVGSPMSHGPACRWGTEGTVRPNHSMLWLDRGGAGPLRMNVTGLQSAVVKMLSEHGNMLIRRGCDIINCWSQECWERCSHCFICLSFPEACDVHSKAKNKQPLPPQKNPPLLISVSPWAHV